MPCPCWAESNTGRLGLARGKTPRVRHRSRAPRELAHDGDYCRGDNHVLAFENHIAELHSA